MPPAPQGWPWVPRTAARAAARAATRRSRRSGAPSLPTSARRLPGRIATVGARGLEAEREARGQRRRVERDAIGERMADEDRAHRVRVVEAAFERQDAEHEVDRLADRPHASLAPRPDLRAHVLHGRDALRLELPRDAQVEFGRVDADEHVGPLADQAGDQVATQAQQPRQVPEDLGEPHHRELVGRVPGLATGIDHARARDAVATQARRPLAAARGSGPPPRLSPDASPATSAIFTSPSVWERSPRPRGHLRLSAPGCGWTAG